MNNGESERSRRTAFTSLLGCLFLFNARSALAQQESQFPDGRPKPHSPDENDDPRMPDGRSQKNAIAKQQHEQALKEADHLVDAAQHLRDILQKAGDYVVPVDAVKQTEEIEKAAKRIRSRLKS